VLVREARLARRLNDVGGALFLLWLALWAWSVFSRRGGLTIVGGVREALLGCRLGR